MLEVGWYDSTHVQMPSAPSLLQERFLNRAPSTGTLIFPLQALAVALDVSYCMLWSIKTEHLATSDAILVSSQDCSAHGGDLRRIETFLDGIVVNDGLFCCLLEY